MVGVADGQLSAGAAVSDGQGLPQGQEECAGLRLGIPPEVQRQGGDRGAVQCDLGGIAAIGEPDRHAAHLIAEGQGGQGAALPDACQVQGLVTGSGGQQGVQQRPHTGGGFLHGGPLPGGLDGQGAVPAALVSDVPVGPEAQGASAFADDFRTVVGVAVFRVGIEAQIRKIEKKTEMESKVVGKMIN